MFLPFYAFLFLVCIFFFGYRHEVGTDYYGYLSIFDRVDDNSGFIKARFEPGFVFVNSVFKSLGFSGNDLLFFLFLLTFLFLFLAIKEGSL
jgi:hypothetical protein